MNEIQSSFVEQWEELIEDGTLSEHQGIRIIVADQDKADVFIDRLLGDEDESIPIIINDDVQQRCCDDFVVTWSLIFSSGQAWVIIDDIQNYVNSRIVFPFAWDDEEKWDKTSQELFRVTIEYAGSSQSVQNVRSLEYWDKRRELVRKKILPIYTSISAGIAAIPIPFSDAMLLIPCQTTMGLHILNSYDLESLGPPVSSLISSTVISQLGRMTASNLLKLVPVIGTLSGTIINSSVASSFTWLLGMAISEISYSFKKARLEGKEPDLEDFFSQLNLRNIMLGIDIRDYDDIS